MEQQQLSRGSPVGAQRPPFPPTTLELPLISPRTSAGPASLTTPRILDQYSPHFRPFPAPLDMPDLPEDTTCNKDQTRRKPRFSTSSLPDIDW
uniref:Uncharacterized protein n=1 Tax=Tetradesmus obliquus TaxID=3088 RepID=A0A383W7C2_TETOB